MRVTSAFCRLLRLEGTWVREVSFEEAKVIVKVALKRKKLVCPEWGYETRSRYDTRPVLSRWRHLDLGAWGLEVVAELRRLACPAHGVVTEGVPFARRHARFTRDFEDLVGFLATTMDKTTICRLVRVDWDSVGRIICRVMGDHLDPGRLEGLFEIGVDEVSWRRRHKYLTLVSSHRTNKVVWGAEGRGAAALDGFFDDLGTERAGGVSAASMDMSAGYAKSVRQEGHAPGAVICIDPFHVVALATKALGTVRRGVWQDMRKLDEAAAKRFRGARWALLKNPANLDDEQAATLRKLKRKGGELWRAYTLKEALRAILWGTSAKPRSEDCSTAFAHARPGAGSGPS